MGSIPTASTNRGPQRESAAGSFAPPRGLDEAGPIGFLVVHVYARLEGDGPRASRQKRWSPMGTPISAMSYDTECAVSLALQYLKKPDGALVDFQNGINDERVAALAGRERCLAASSPSGPACTSPARHPHRP